MDYINKSRITIKLNNRAKISLLSIKEYNVTVGYDVSLFYWIKNRFLDTYSWVEINNKTFPAITVLSDEERLNNIIDDLLDRGIKSKKVDNLIKNKLSDNIKKRWNFKK